MKVTVDYLVCEANGVCVGLAPDVFDLDDEDNLTVLVEDVPPAQEAKVRHAVRSCPKAALTLSE
ncbi:ferredoxin [Actinocorallia sp. API 0066]|uniref:ferredoxin n=1 Tax=Actinocorallia sp. API 0066 TaxID=2896846 RepID=UPI001E33C330|nr:ferredoxin [Actinocorallia sp. API 0066]MCD0448199.1 ferredoxin [Actinocorallia sp. API 0066]